MSLRERIGRSTVANAVAGFLVVAGMAYFIAINDAKGVMFLTGTGVGWLFKEVKDRLTSSSSPSG